GCLAGASQRDDCPWAKRPASALKCKTHIKGLDAGLIFGLHNDVAAVWPAIDRVELRFSQRLRRSLCLGYRREAAGVEGCQIVVTRRLDVMSELRVHLDHDATLLIFCAFGLLTAIFRIDNQRAQAIST